MSTITLHGVPVDLNSDTGRQFTLQACRAAEGQISDKELQEEFELSPEELRTLAENKALGRAIRVIRDQRVRSGAAARELAAKHFVKAPGILDSIMCDTSTSPRFRIDSAKALQQAAIPENPNSPSNDSRFIIQINLGSDVEIYNKSRAVNADDEPPKLPPERPKLTVIQGFENDE